MRKTVLNRLAITALALAGSMDAAKAEKPTPTPTPKQWVVIELFGEDRKATAKANAKTIIRSKSNITNNKQAATPAPTPKTMDTASSFDVAGNAMRSKTSKPTPTPTPKQQH